MCEIVEEVLRQFEVVKSEALQDKRLLHYLQQEVARFQDIENVEVKDSGYMMNSSLAWCAGFVGVAGGCSDLPGVFGAKNNAVLRRKARSNSSSSFALFVGNVPHTATGKFFGQLCDDSFLVCEALVSTFNWVVADIT